MTIGFYTKNDTLKHFRDFIDDNEELVLAVDFTNGIAKLRDGDTIICVTGPTETALDYLIAKDSEEIPTVKFTENVPEVYRIIEIKEENWIEQLKREYSYCDKIEFLPFPSVSPENFIGLEVICGIDNTEADVEKCKNCSYGNYKGEKDA